MSIILFKREFFPYYRILSCSNENFFPHYRILSCPNENFSPSLLHGKAWRAASYTKRQIRPEKQKIPPFLRWQRKSPTDFSVGQF